MILSGQVRSGVRIDFRRRRARKTGMEVLPLGAGGLTRRGPAEW